MSQSSLPAEIRSLSIHERIRLVQQIWDSIVNDEGSLQLNDAQKAELDRRIEAHNTKPDRGSPWEVVNKRLLID
jgi:putative addiction module component (TIGR02574 family)